MLATDGITLEEDTDEHALAGPKPTKEQAAAAKKLKEDKAAAAKQEKQEHEAARAALLHKMTLEELGRIQTIHDHLTNVDTLCSLVDNGTLPASKVFEAVKPKDSPPELEYWSGLVTELQQCEAHERMLFDSLHSNQSDLDLSVASLLDSQTAPSDQGAVLDPGQLPGPSATAPLQPAAAAAASPPLVAVAAPAPAPLSAIAPTAPAHPPPAPAPTAPATAPSPTAPAPSHTAPAPAPHATVPAPSHIAQAQLPADAAPTDTLQPALSDMSDSLSRLWPQIVDVQERIAAVSAELQREERELAYHFGLVQRGSDNAKKWCRVIFQLNVDCVAKSNMSGLRMAVTECMKHKYLFSFVTAENPFHRVWIIDLLHLRINVIGGHVGGLVLMCIVYVCVDGTQRPAAEVAKLLKRLPELRKDLRTKLKAVARATGYYLEPELSEVRGEDRPMKGNQGGHCLKFSTSRTKWLQCKGMRALAAALGKLNGEELVDQWVTALCSTSQLASTRTKLTAEQSAQLDASLDTLQKVLSDNRVAPFLTAGDYEHGLWSHVRPQLCRYETLLPFSCQGSEGQNKVVNQDRARNDMRGGCGVSRTGGLYRRGTCNASLASLWLSIVGSPTLSRDTVTRSAALGARCAGRTPSSTPVRQHLY